MKDLFDTASARCSRLITQTYSTSFSLGIRCLHKDFRMPIYSIYGFVRFADEIVDTFHDADKEKLLQAYIIETNRSIEEKLSLNPILHSFQHVVHKYGIEKELIDTFIASMQTDLYRNHYDKKQYEKYILGSAEVVGLMCLRIFTEGDTTLYETLKPGAMRLGSAFQKINFLRDLREDYMQLGRVYFPGLELSRFDEISKKAIEKDIEKDFLEAYKSIMKLPKKARFGVYLTYTYYYALFKKIKKVPAGGLLNKRIRIENSKKIRLLVRSYFRYRYI